jgi:pyrroline-5-carboxylate reductase
MNINTIGFIGGGRITRIMLGGLKAGRDRMPDVVVSDTSADVLVQLSAQYSEVISAGADNRKPAAQDLVVVALHPPAMAPVLEDIKRSLRPESTLVSLAPKITLARLSELLDGFTRVVRMIPNAPSIKNVGYNPVAYGAGMSAEDRETVNRFFEPLGECPEVAESKLEGFALLTGMGPTYLWFQLQVLRELATQFGLQESDVVPALKSMVCGSAQTLLESGLSPDEVMDLIPVKPLAGEEAAIEQAYRDRLTELYAKISPS